MNKEWVFGRKPEPMKNVLFRTEKGNIYKGYMTSDNVWVIENAKGLPACYFRFVIVTAWIELPDTDDEGWRNQADGKPEIGSYVLSKDWISGEIYLVYVATPYRWIIRNKPDDKDTFWQESDKNMWMPVPDMKKNYKAGDTVYWFDSYGNIAQGVISAIDDETVSVIRNNTALQADVKLSECWTSREECRDVKLENEKTTKDKYKETIRNVNDLVRFLFAHDFCSGQVDSDIKDAARERAKELLRITLD